MKDKNQTDEVRIKKALEYGNRIIATLREPFLVLDKDLRVISANRSFYDTFKVAEKDTIGRLLPDLGNKQWNIPKLLVLLREILPEKRVVENYEIEHKFEQLGERQMNLNASCLRIPKKIISIIAATVTQEEEEEEEEEEELILMAIEDITERKLEQEKLKVAEERFHAAFETSRDGLLLAHKVRGEILNSNAAVQEMLGYSREEFLKVNLWEINVVKDHDSFQEMMVKLEKDGAVYFKEMLVRAKDGIDVVCDVTLTNRAKVIQCNIRNMTERRENERESRNRLHELEVFYRASMGREERIIELKNEIEEIKKELKEIKKK